MITSIASNLASAMSKGFFKENSLNQMNYYKKFRVFYDKDLDEIKEIIYQEMIDKEIISLDTPLQRVIINHLDIISKTIGRKVSGIFDNAPKITLEDESGKVIEANKTFNELITKLKLFEKVDEATDKAEFMNIALIQVIWRDGELELDVLTPDMFVVIPKDNYNKMRKIILPRCKYNEDGSTEMFDAVWTHTEHYLVMSDGTIQSVDGNPKNLNPYKTLPFAILRMKEGNNFLGEPDSELLDNQIMIDLLWSGTNSSEVKNVNEITLLTGMALEKGSDGKVRIKANEVLVQGPREKDEPPADIKRIGSEVDTKQSLDNVEKRVKIIQMTKGLPASSSSVDQKELSGASKSIDEVELAEYREKLKWKIYNFLMELIPIIILVYNTPPPSAKNKPKKIEGKYKINIELSEEKIVESVSDKKIRREEEIKYNMATPIDFIQEDKEVDEKKAQEIYTKNKQWKIDNGHTDEPKIPDDAEKDKQKLDI